MKPWVRSVAGVAVGSTVMSGNVWFGRLLPWAFLNDRLLASAGEGPASTIMEATVLTVIAVLAGLGGVIAALLAGRACTPTAKWHRAPCVATNTRNRSAGPHRRPRSRPGLASLVVPTSSSATPSCGDRAARTGCP